MTDTDRPRPIAWLVLVVLFIVYTLNFLDRSLVYILFKPIKAEFAFTDLQLALLGSTAFVLFYTTLGVPFGRLADRYRRTWLIAAGLVVWSVASSLTGFATTFGGLLACRMIVGVGEATLGPAAYSLLADWFPPRWRGTTAALFCAGIPLGGGLAMAAGGAIAQDWGWRAAFPMLGLPGLLVAAVVMMLPEPERGAAKGSVAEAGEPFGVVLRASVTPWLHTFGYATFAIAASAWSIWVPSYIAARWSLELKDVGLMFGLCTVVGGLIGTTLGGVTADLLQRRFLGGRMAFGAIVALLSAFAWLGLLTAETPNVAYIAVTFGMAFGLAWLGPASADVQDLVAPEHRGVAISSYYLVVNLLSYGLGAPMLGALNDVVPKGSTGLVACPIVCLVAAGLLVAGSYSRAPAAAVASPLAA